MSTDTQELIRALDQLPGAKRVEVMNFARFLLAQLDDQRWEQIISESKPRPKLDAYLNVSKAEGSGRWTWTACDSRTRASFVAVDRVA